MGKTLSPSEERLLRYNTKTEQRLAIDAYKQFLGPTEYDIMNRDSLRAKYPELGRVFNQIDASTGPTIDHLPKGEL